MLHQAGARLCRPLRGLGNLMKGDEGGGGASGRGGPPARPPDPGGPTRKHAWPYGEYLTSRERGLVRNEVHVLMELGIHAAAGRHEARVHRRAGQVPPRQADNLECWVGWDVGMRVYERDLLIRVPLVHTR